MRNQLIVLLLMLCFLGCKKENFYEVVELESSIEPTIITKNLYLKIGDDQEYFHDGYAVKSGNAIKVSSHPIQCNRFTFDRDQAEEEGDIVLELGVIDNKVEVINASVYLPGADRILQLNQVENVQSEINLLSFSEDSIAGSVFITQHDSNFDFDSVVISFSLPMQECNLDYLMTNLKSVDNSLSDILEGHAAVSGFDSIRRVLYFASFSQFECDTSTTSTGGFGISVPIGSDAFPENSDSLEVIFVVAPHINVFWSWVQIKERGQTLSLRSGLRGPCAPPSQNFNINIEYEDEEIIQGTFEADYYLIESPEKQGDCDILTFYDHLTFSFRMNFKTCG